MTTYDRSTSRKYLESQKFGKTRFLKKKSTMVSPPSLVEVSKLTIAHDL